MELDTVNVHNLIGMEQGSSKDPWISRDCLFDSDTLQEIFHMDIRCCNNTDRFNCPALGFDFGDVLALEENQEDLIDFTDSRSRNSNSNLQEFNNLDEFSDGDDLASTLVNLNSILPRNLSVPVRSPMLDSERPILETVNVENIAENEEEETENESEAEQTENDGESEEEEEDEEEEEEEEEDEDEEEEDEEEEEEEQEEQEQEEEEEEEIENEENEQNETEYETEEESQEEAGEEEEEDMEGDEHDTVAYRRSFTPSSMEALTISPSSMIGDSGSLTASSSPTVQLMRMHMQHPKMNTVSGMVKLHDIKTLTANSSDQISQHIRKQIYNNNVHDGNSNATAMMIQTTKRDKNLMSGHRDNPYPKPAYSYSCLIAMALKNSRTGSLPVSEIYNFMCRHFPYFKTAPNGWKNSVRHNLSLNKCFEKIEKPPGNGSQRKGCLWAIHPSKVAKMDEEVRKWSRKDPVAIKQAMVYPDHLELLERGDMKYENDRHEELYEDADSYVGSEMGGSAGDEIMETINDEENIMQETRKLNRKHIDTMDDDIVDDDIVEQFYDEFDIESATDNDTLLDTRLNIPKQKQSFMYELVSCAKRQKTLLNSSIQSDYIYQQIDTSSRRKTQLVALRPGTTPSSGSFCESN